MKTYLQRKIQARSYFCTLHTSQMATPITPLCLHLLVLFVIGHMLQNVNWGLLYSECQL